MDSDMEDYILTRVDITRELHKLCEMDRIMMELIYHHSIPYDWRGPWPPKYSDIGVYIGIKYEKKALSEAAIRYRRDKIKDKWREDHHG